LHALSTCQLEFSLKNRFNILYFVIFVQKLWKRAKTNFKSDAPKIKGIYFARISLVRYQECKKCRSNFRDFWPKISQLFDKSCIYE
jgi:hypothetical protein